MAPKRTNTGICLPLPSLKRVKEEPYSQTIFEQAPCQGSQAGKNPEQAFTATMQH